MFTHEAKRVLCFGDSNTWGYKPLKGGRFGPSVRWPGVMQAILGTGYEVIEEGLNGRTTVWDDPIEGHKNGAKQLPPCLDTHNPLDLVIIMLGSNDLKRRFSVSARDIACGIGALGKIVLQNDTGLSPRPQVLLVSPIHMLTLQEAWLSEIFGGDATERSRQIWGWLQEVGKKLGIPCFDAALAAGPDGREGLHMAKEGHEKLGKALAGEVKRMIG